MGHEDVVGLLLAQQECDINLKDKKGQTPLHQADSMEHNSIVDLLLLNGAIVDADNEDDDVEVQLSNAALMQHAGGLWSSAESSENRPSAIVEIKKYFKQQP